MPAMTSAFNSSITEIARLEHLRPEHVRQNDHALTAVDPFHGFQNIDPAGLHIVVRADRNRLERRLRSDDVLERISEFLSKPAMRDD